MRPKTYFCLTLIGGFLVVYYYQITTIVLYKGTNKSILQKLSLFRVGNDNSKQNAGGFSSFLINWKWLDYENVTRSQNLSLIKHLTEKIIVDLTPFLIMESREPINVTCKAPKLKHLNCIQLTKPRKLAVMLQLGFDADILEIHINELYDIVDRIFITESTRTHFNDVKKPLIWELVKDQTRFLNFKEKVVHFVLDDSDTVLIHRDNSNATLTAGWEMELLQERKRWIKFLKWNNMTNFFESHDMLGFGDVDEIPNRDTVNYLKHCEVPDVPIDIGIWFPFGNIQQAFQTDFPVKGHPYTLGDPTYWKLHLALNFKKYQPSKVHNYPSRNRGKSPHFLLGGMHMTQHGYLPFQIVKRLTLTESSVDLILSTINILKTIKTTEQLLDAELKLSDIPEAYKNRTVPISKLLRTNEFDMQNVAILPWFYNCNRKRYPSWERKHDTRLD